MEQDLEVRAITPVFFIATKLEAFRGRGKGDYMASHDLEDTLTVLAGLPDLRTQIEREKSGVVLSVRSELVSLRGSEAFIDAVPANFEGDRRSGSRRECAELARHFVRVKANSQNVMLLYRPVGLEELRLIYEAGMRAFPPRLPDQPIFYPVTNEGYASQIAREWNTKSGTLAGLVTRFSVGDDYAEKFERKVVGSREHEELWVPAEELPEFNEHIEGRIEVVAAFFGDAFRGYVPEAALLEGADARQRFVLLGKTLADKGFSCETAFDHVAVFLDFFYWEQGDFTAEGFDPAARDRILTALRTRWETSEHRSVPLGVTR